MSVLGPRWAGRVRGWSARTIVLAAGMSVVLLVSLAPPAAAVPAPAPAGPALTPAPEVSPGPAVTRVKPLQSRFAKPDDDAARTATAEATAWPRPGRATVALAAGRGAGDGSAARAAGTPVWARPVVRTDGYHGPSSVDVQVLDQVASRAAGVRGLLVTVDPAGAGRGEVRVGVDYAGFAQAYGGNYGARLRLVRLPACALSAPAVPDCRRPTPLPSINDATARTVSAPLTLDSGGERMVLAAVADAGGDGSDGGTYAATDLKPSGSWSGSGSTGSFTYSYPITLPATASTLAPQVGLSYDSGAVDGQTVATQAQASWVGDGWSTPRSFIEQTFASCADEPGGSPAPKPTPDRCYDGPVLSMSLNGATTALVWDAGKQVWRPQAEDGSVVTHVVNSGNGSGTYNTDYWRVTARDGTVYEFGRNRLPGWSSGKPATNSVDRVPVYSPRSGDPCYDSSGFAASVCDMAYRWNLDHVLDVHGNAMAFYYHQDVNYYGRNEGAANDDYVRDSYLERIDFGFRDGGAYATVANRVVFGTGPRCLSGTCTPLGGSTKANWPDVPYDLVCASGATCTSWSPSFFSTVRLTSITTQQWDTATSGYATVDSYALTHTIPATGDGNAPTLWLSSISRTGHDTTAGGSTAPISLPSVSFTSVRLPNRVDPDGLTAFYRHRLETITTETGSVITVSYERPQPCSAPVTVDPATNTRSCYPVYWTPDGYTAPFRDWFNKYAVTRVTATDPTGGAPATSTSYQYAGGAAWRYDENEVVKKKYRTYGQFRGYGTVRTLTGDGVNDPQTLQVDTFYRGMSRNNSSTTVTVTDSAGGVHEDVDQLAGRVLESTANLGNGGPVDHSTITSYWVSEATATRSRTGLPALTARWVAPVLTHSRQAVTGSGATTWRYSATDNAYDTSTTSPTVGVLKYSYSHTVPRDPAYDRCTAHTYAPVNTTKHLVGLIAQVETVSVACGGYTAGSPASVPGSLNTLTAPATVDRPAQVVSVERTFYDDTTWSTTFPQPTAPSTGNVTMTRKAAGHTGGAYTWQTTGRATFDGYGRPTEVYDGNGNRTTTAYTTSSLGLTTAATVTNPLGHSSSTTLSTRRGLMLTATDPNGVVTTSQYDALGRTTAVWLYSRAGTSPSANYTFAYQVQQTGVTATTSKQLNDSSGYITTTTIYDAQLRVRQTQTITPQSGRMITDTFYDTRGWTRSTNNGWWDPRTTPNTTPVRPDQVSPPPPIPNQTVYTYDGLGRPVITVAAKNGLEVSRTTTVHNGDRTTVIPPDGGVTTTTVTDPVGRTSQLIQYSATPTLNTPANTFTGIFTISGGTPVTAGYGYDGHGNQNSVTDPGGATWTTSYNLLGQTTAKTDPDAGATTGMTYDGNGNLLQSTDSRGKTISYTYDALGRKTGTYTATTAGQSTANQLASWVYDNTNNAVTGMKYPIGQLTTATAYWGPNRDAYTVQQRNFNIFGKSLGQTITVPASEGLLGGAYTFTYVYSTTTGLLGKTVYPAKGGLPTETLNHGYAGGLDLPSTLGGLGGYSDGVTYDAFGRVNQQTLGASPNWAYVTNTWDEHTGRLTQRLVTRAATTPAEVDKQQYFYDKAGNITRHTDTRTGNTATYETQCYRYDKLRRLSQAWTATDSCATAPTPTNRAMVGDPLGAASAYWTGWQHDTVGNRTQQTQYSTTGGADTTTTYTHNNPGQPHALTGTTTSGATTASTAYGYDTAGHMTSRTAGNGNQTLTWDDAGQLTAVTGNTTGDSSYLYDGDGNLVLQKDPGQTTLYLPGQQHTLNTTTQTVTGARYYPLPGGVGTAIRTGTGTNYTFTLTDQHHTPTLYLDNTAQTPTWRQYTPYGQPRGTTATRPDNRGFLNQPENTTTGLTHLGARKYDPTTGGFISIDPLMDLTDPQQWNGYAYAHNNPTTNSDPSGLIDHDCMDHDCYGYDPKTGCPHGCGTDENVEWGKKNGKSSTKSNGRHDRDRLGRVIVMPDDLDKDRFATMWADRRADYFRNASYALAGDDSAAADLLRAHDEFALAMEICADLGGSACDTWLKEELYPGYLATLGPMADESGPGGPVAMPAAALAKAEANGLGGLLRRAGCGNSFAGDTKVLMADGSTKPIDEVRVGDEVMATNPETGEQGTHEVTHVWVHDDQLRDLVLDNGTAVTTTEDHPYWNATDHQWQRADALSGDNLLGPQGQHSRVVGLRLGPTTPAPAYNLTVAGIHTYYVLAGNTPVLVHNTGPCGVAGHPTTCRCTITGPGGESIPGVPNGAVGVPSPTGKGMVYDIPRGTQGLDPRVTQVRVMDPITIGKYQYPNGYVVYMNSSGQTVNPLTGRTVAKSDPYAHIALP